MAKPSAKEVAQREEKLYLPEGVVFASDLPENEDLEYVIMPEWWQKGTNTKGIPFKKYIVLAGDSDSGKTSACIAAVKAATDQGYRCIYAETEGKTSKQDFKNWGVDLSKVIFISNSIADDLYQKLKDTLILFKKEKILLIIDSLGNVVSKHDLERNLSESSSKPGGKGQANRTGLTTILSYRHRQDLAVLLITYTYDNIGSPGKTNAGGKVVNLLNALCYQTSRKSWIEKTVKGEKVRIGAKVQWKLFKNHIDRQNPGPKVIELDITADGIKLAGDVGDE